jgi:hypothetical protein
VQEHGGDDEKDLGVREVTLSESVLWMRRPAIMSNIQPKMRLSVATGRR